MAWKTVYAPAIAAAAFAFAATGGIRASEKVIKAEERPARISSVSQAAHPAAHRANSVVAAHKREKDKPVTATG